MAAARFGKACDSTSRNSSLSPRARGLWRHDCSSGALEVLIATLAYLQRAKRKALNMLPVHWGGGCARGSRFSGQHSDNKRGITVFVLLAKPSTRLYPFGVSAHRFLDHQHDAFGVVLQDGRLWSARRTKRTATRYYHEWKELSECTSSMVCAPTKTSSGSN